jgi:hypothetical protein
VVFLVFESVRGAGLDDRWRGQVRERCAPPGRFGSHRGAVGGRNNPQVDAFLAARRQVGAAAAAAAPRRGAPQHAGLPSLGGGRRRGRLPGHPEGSIRADDLRRPALRPGAPRPASTDARPPDERVGGPRRGAARAVDTSSGRNGQDWSASQAEWARCEAGQPRPRGARPDGARLRWSNAVNGQNLYRPRERVFGGVRNPRVFFGFFRHFKRRAGPTGGEHFRGRTLGSSPSNL